MNHVQRIDVFSHHPESGRKWTVHEVLDVTDFKAALRDFSLYRYPIIPLLAVTLRVKVPFNGIKVLLLLGFLIIKEVTIIHFKLVLQFIYHVMSLWAQI